MVRYRRDKSDNPDEIYFITITVRDRNDYCLDINDFIKITKSLDESMNHSNGRIEAYVYLPDHIHLLIRQGDVGFSDRIRSFKIKSNYKIFGKQKSVWQQSFWEHRIRDDQDFINHVEYIHFNPVKHGHVHSPKDWKYSSFKNFVKDGTYDISWSSINDIVVQGPIDQ
jgi:REP-associated tyrosine transposase